MFACKAAKAKPRIDTSEEQYVKSAKKSWVFSLSSLKNPAFFYILS
ncbi:hypothetical protein GXM_07190 [Nostoc sphaeroides CCNUC1]|uniref:Uncharacterized protein n=1 Tax=Nostoc sphaeroides CCNUC1 TaxID=2653204 RepID=A0A5P8WBY0_9NOSO|nr:hypothetical protein GXM_07190 [Nostoc sphaeroides CCNUC1]